MADVQPAFQPPFLVHLRPNLKPVSFNSNKGHAEGADNEVLAFSLDALDALAKGNQEQMGATTLYGYLQEQTDLHPLQRGEQGVIAQYAAKTFPRSLEVGE